MPIGALIGLLVLGGVACGTTATGKLEPGDATMTQRLNVNGVSSSCASAKPFPGTVAGGPFEYDTHSFASGDQDSCAEITLNHDIPVACGTGAHAIAYLNSFDPTNLSANYLGDEGTDTTHAFKVNVPAHSNLIVVVQENNPPNTTCDYSVFVAFEVSDLAIDKTDSADPVAPGQTFTYDLSVTNSSLQNSSARVVDTIPAGTTFVSASVADAPGFVITSKPSPGGTGTVIFTGAPFSTAFSSPRVLHITVKVKSTVQSGTVITNTASISSTTSPGSNQKPTPDSDLSNNSDTETTTVQAPASCPDGGANSAAC